jgi:hypothetical protein
MNNLVLQIDSDNEDRDEVEDAHLNFNDVFTKVFPKGIVAMIAKNHGWRKLDGYRTPEFFKTGIAAISKATLNGQASCRAYVRKNKEYGYHIAVNTAHHDSPVWDEWTYMVRPKYLKIA